MHTHQTNYIYILYLYIIHAYIPIGQYTYEYMYMHMYYRMIYILITKFVYKKLLIQLCFRILLSKPICCNNLYIYIHMCTHAYIQKLVYKYLYLRDLPKAIKKYT